MIEIGDRMLIKTESKNQQEIVIGLVAPLGTDLDRLSDALQRELSKHYYDSQLIRLSSLLVNKNYDPTYDGSPEDSKTQSEVLMDAGDALRETFESGDVVAALGIAKMRKMRIDAGLEPGTQTRRHAWIIRTLKNTEEVALLRFIYGSRFVLIGVNEPESQRTHSFEETLKQYDPLLTDISGQAAKLIRRDEKDPTSKFGQQVRKTNELSDFYVDVDNNLIHDAKRIVSLLFGKPFETPTRDEQNMFHAFAASLRSSDSGRQVGAVIATKEGDILAVGTNEVPKPGGGQFWPGDDRDQRDFQVGRDHNKWQNRRAIQEILDILKQQGFLSEDLMELTSQDRLKTIFGELPRQTMESENGSTLPVSMNDSRVASLIEFGRITHAEMSVITDAARHGKSTANTTIYVTAFPCHMCMRLIIASGIIRVVYVDPYPKSLAVEMYGKLISFDDTVNSGRVSIGPFRGVSWRIFDRMFSMINRKRSDSGHFESSSPPNREFRSSDVENVKTAIYREALLVSELRNAGIRDSEIDPSTVDNVDHKSQNSFAINTLAEVPWLSEITDQAWEEVNSRTSPWGRA